MMDRAVGSPFTRAVLALLAAVLLSACFRTSQGRDDARTEQREPRQTPVAATPDGTTRRLGPFVLGRRQFTVVIVRPEAEHQPVRLEVRDADGRLYYSREFESSDDVSSHDISAGVVEGTGGQALLIHDSFDGTPPGAEIEILAMRGETLVPLFPPAVTYRGSFSPTPSGQPDQVVRLLEGDRINKSSWSDRYTTVTLLRVDLACDPGGACVREEPPDRSTMPGFELVQLLTSVDLLPHDASIALFQAPGADGEPEIIRVRTTSRIELLHVARPLAGGRGPGEWMLVRIDGREGWIQEEDYPEIGVGTAG